jgi:beta-N-acetylhexosaminidase
MSKSSLTKITIRFSSLALLFLVSIGAALYHGDDFDEVSGVGLPPVFLQGESVWADSVLATLSLEEKIAQLFMVAAYSNKGKAHEDEIKRLIYDYKIGGLIFFQGGPLRQAHLTNAYQEIANVPLMISIDGEWGLAMRLDSTVKYPKQMTLGAIQDNRLIYDMGAEIARQSARLGIHVNFAPVVDVNNNINNPVINNRSFGENKYNVAEKGIAYMRGMQDFGVLANAKHFPGHGDTDTDSHYALPVVNHSRERLDTLEIYPFKELIKNGLGSVMVAHMHIPSLDNTPKIASTLSKPIVTDLLQKELGFKGLIFTDALNMKGVSSYHKPGEVDLKALLAGNDVLLFAENVPKAIYLIKEAIENGDFSEDEIDRRCLKILKAKEWVGLNKNKKVEVKNLVEDLNNPQARTVNRQLYEAAMTLLKNDEEIIPLKKVHQKKVASLVIGDKVNNQFQLSMQRYMDIEKFSLPKTPSPAEMVSIKSKLADFDVVVVSIHGTNNSPKSRFGLTQQTIDLVKDLQGLNGQLVVTIFGNPYMLSKFYGVEKSDAVIMAYEDNALAQDVAGQLIFGAFSAKGKLPITASTFFKYGSGLTSDGGIRFKYTLPEDAGLNSDFFDKIDDIANRGIKEKAYPGCQVLIAKEGKVIYNKSFGYHTYENQQKVTNDDIYDLASITKIVASTAAVMKLHEMSKIDLDDQLGDYLNDIVGDTEYANVNLRDMLAHQAGLPAWIPFYVKTMENRKPREDLYSSTITDIHSTQVADDLFIRTTYKDSIFRRIQTVPIKKGKEYKYSDVGYYFIKEIIERQTGMKMEEYVEKEFYQPLMARTLGYLPRNKFPLERIVPTEYDVAFRRQLVHGYVHDPGAAMQGGVGGHAGAFSNANDLAIMMQMLINGGTYGGENFLYPETIKEFTRCQFCVGKNGNRRGAGFDKPVRDGSGGPTCDCVSFESFGHSGFTGTITWADPEQEVVYVFLSNRIYPNAENKKLITSGIRTKIQQVIYDAINEASAEIMVNQ